MMKSGALGKDISAVEILNISPNGIWILVLGKEYFLDYENFPWFQNASLQKVFNVELLHNNHLHWPDLDVDLELAAINDPKQNILL